MSDSSNAQSSLDLVTIAPAGYAAYWLSVKRLADTKRGPQALSDELQYAAEPYTRLLLGAAASNMDEALMERMARNKSQVLLRDYRRKFRAMRQAACAIASGENPRKTLITLSGGFGLPVSEETRLMEQAQNLIETMRAGKLDMAVFPDVSHTTRPEELVLKLLVFTLWARRDARTGLQVFLPGMSFPFMADALRLCIDGLEEPYIRRRLEAQARDILLDAAHKMRLGLDLALALKARRSYDEVLVLARSHLLEL
ncbi:hypothetical protein [Fundidesulfovibrio soli]|uniref:hypothetical protein n=1 Tax=Fundidesulfovibrio soli TaxID=2922716 RepID=UPI001FAF5EDF|nr:hypothetical protein [Fundidesulfovibrio soli]